MRLPDRKEALLALHKIGVTVGSERWPTPEDVIRGSQEAQANILQRARSDLVKRYRANPAGWPQGITGKNSSDQWYNAADWSDDGKWIASHKPPWLMPAEISATASTDQKSLTPSTASRIREEDKPTPAQVAAAIRTVVPSKPVTNPVTNVTPDVTTVTKSVTPVTAPVTLPATHRTALTNAERQAKWRAKQAALKASTILNSSLANPPTSLTAPSSIAI